MDDEQIRLIAKEAGREGGREVCRTLGFDPDDPKSMRTYHANQAFVYKLRIGTEDTGKVIRRSAVKLCLVGVCTLLWWGITFWRDNGPPPGS